MSDPPADDLRPEYPPDLIRSGERGKYAALLDRWRELPPVDPDDLRDDLDSLLDPHLVPARRRRKV